MATEANESKHEAPYIRTIRDWVDAHQGRHVSRRLCSPYGASVSDGILAGFGPFRTEPGVGEDDQITIHVVNDEDEPYTILTGGFSYYEEPPAFARAGLIPPIVDATDDTLRIDFGTAHLEVVELSDTEATS